jgi:pilus assembly protein Flp/PilA
MKQLVLKIRRFLAYDGPTAVEYAVMLALIVTVCIAVIGVLGSSTKTTFDGTTSSMGTGS